MLLKRIFCALLSCMLAMAALSALAENQGAKAFVMAGYDDTQYRDWNTNEFFARMEEKTGVSFSFQQYTELEKWTAAKAAMTKDGDLPDVLFKATLSAAESMEMLEKGVLIDLAPYLEECCPNLWRLLSENPDALAAITLPDGRIAALPYINPLPVQNYMWINTAWLETLHLSAPTTADELVTVLEAFKTRDPNRNGRADEIPLGFLGAFDLKFLAHAFGLICNDYNIFAEDGKVKFMPLEKDFRVFVTWCRDLYQQGLLDHDGFTTNNTFRQVTDSDAAATYGIIITPSAADIFRVSWAENYNILEPLFCDGEQVYRDFAGSVLRGTFAVTSHCSEPETLLRWADYLYSEEGAILASNGKETEDYLIDGDGTWHLTEDVKSDSFFSSTALIDGGGTAPGIMAADFQRRYGGNAYLLKVIARQDAVNTAVRMPFPYYNLSREQQQTITALQNEIGYYVDMQIARWILGEEEISDETFAVFESTLEEMGLPAFLAFWQDVLDHL